MKLSYKVNKFHSGNQFYIVNNSMGYFMEMIERALDLQYGDLQRSYNTIVKKVNRLGSNDFLSISLRSK